MSRAVRGCLRKADPEKDVRVVEIPPANVKGQLNIPEKNVLNNGMKKNKCFEQSYRCSTVLDPLPDLANEGTERLGEVHVSTAKVYRPSSTTLRHGTSGTCDIAYAFLIMEVRKTKRGWRHNYS
ncbi:hypothetical protein RB195_007133 [Necator americanus]|uniref:Uncharacterized protein n=1 Tax=Necator americanus TaxID=51031 RepID=A0ABR1BZ38_NECAM